MQANIYLVIITLILMVFAGYLVLFRFGRR